MRPSILPILILLAFVSGCGSPVEPSMSTWNVKKMYLIKQITHDELNNLSAEELLKKDKVSINDSRLETLFQRAEFRGDFPVMKGEVYAVIGLSDGSYKKLWISWYGSFFGVVDQKKKGFFKFKGNDSKVWNELVFGMNRPSQEQANLR